MSTPPYDPNQQYPQPGNPYGVPSSPGPYSADNPYVTPGYQSPTAYQAPGYQTPGSPPQGYAAPGYAAPGYAPGYQGAGYPPPYGYAVLPPSATTNTMAIMSLVFAFVFPPLGVVFGHMARKQIKERGEGGEGLATAGLIVGYIFTAFYVIGCAIWVIAVFFLASTAAAVTSIPTG